MSHVIEASANFMDPTRISWYHDCVALSFPPLICTDPSAVATFPHTGGLRLVSLAGGAQLVGASPQCTRAAGSAPTQGTFSGGMDGRNSQSVSLKVNQSIKRNTHFVEVTLDLHLYQLNAAKYLPSVIFFSYYGS